MQADHNADVSVKNNFARSMRRQLTYGILLTAGAIVAGSEIISLLPKGAFTSLGAYLVANTYPLLTLIVSGGVLIKAKQSQTNIENIQDWYALNDSVAKGLKKRPQRSFDDLTATLLPEAYHRNSFKVAPQRFFNNLLLLACYLVMASCLLICISQPLFSSLTSKAIAFGLANKVPLFGFVSGLTGYLFYKYAEAKRLSKTDVANQHVPASNEMSWVKTVSALLMAVSVVAFLGTQNHFSDAVEAAGKGMNNLATFLWSDSLVANIQIALGIFSVTVLGFSYLEYRIKQYYKSQEEMNTQNAAEEGRMPLTHSALRSLARKRSGENKPKETMIIDEIPQEWFAEQQVADEILVSQQPQPIEQSTAHNQCRPGQSI